MTKEIQKLIDTAQFKADSYKRQADTAKSFSEGNRCNNMYSHYMFVIEFIRSNSK